MDWPTVLASAAIAAVPASLAGALTAHLAWKAQYKRVRDDFESDLGRTKAREAARPLIGLFARAQATLAAHGLRKMSLSTILKGDGRTTCFFEEFIEAQVRLRPYLTGAEAVHLNALLNTVLSEEAEESEETARNAVSEMLAFLADL